MSTITRFISLWLLAGSAVLPAQTTVEFQSLKEGILEERLRLAHPKVALRYQRLRALFEESGCPDLQTQKVPNSKQPNLICIVSPAEPQSTRRIIVGAHFDSAGGDGVVDNWTGAILLPSLAQFIRQKPRRHAFHFVGFAAEERGLWGSTEYLRKIKRQDRPQIAAVLALDSLGLTPTKYWPNSSSRPLIELAAQVAEALKLSFAGVNVDNVGTTDSMTFFRAEIPTLSLHSITEETWRLINSPKDIWASLSWKDYYDTHRLIFALLAYFDQVLP